MRWRLLVLLTLALPACQSPRCEVHGDPLVSRRVPILYGLIDPPGDRRTTYPHADLVLGGCVVDDDSPAETRRWPARSKRSPVRGHQQRSSGCSRRSTASRSRRP